MQKENKINAKRYIELENWLLNNIQNNMSLEELIEILWNFSKEEREYIIMAKQMPKEEIEKSIEYYDSFKGLNRLDAIKFVNDLAQKYSTDRETIIKRIQQVRSIIRIEKLKNKQMKKIKISDLSL